MSEVTPFQDPAMRASVIILALMLGVCGGLLVTAVGKVREAANWANCTNNMRLFGMAHGTYHDNWGKFPPGTVINPALPPRSVSAGSSRPTSTWSRASCSKAWTGTKAGTRRRFALSLSPPSGFSIAPQIRCVTLRGHPA